MNNTGKLPWRIRLQDMCSERSTFEGHWREIEKFMAPGRLRLGKENAENKGGKKHQKIIDETALRARRVFTAGFVSGITSPARPWFKLTVIDDELSEFHSVKSWLEEVEKRINVVLQRSNFYQAIANCYDNLGTFGTAAMSVVERRESIVWFHPHPVGDFYISANSDMIVDTIYRETRKTVRNLVETYGLENCSSSTQSAYKNSQMEQRVDVVQAIEPNDERIMGRAGYQGMPYRSVWFEQSGPEDQYLGKRGFHEFPSMGVRWDATAMDDYGVDCPGMTALGGVKQLQHEQLKKAQAVDKMVNPHLQIPTEVKGLRNFLPGGTTTYDQTNPHGGIRPIHDVNLNLQYVIEDIREIQRRINESYFVDMFLMMSEQDDVRTATEISLRHEEKLLVLGPALQRVQTELLDPMIDRVFSILVRTGNIPEPPPEMSDMPLRVKYISMLAQAQQSVGASSIERFVNVTGTIAAYNQDILHKVDFDETVEEYADILGVPNRLVRSDDDAAASREAVAEQQRQAAQMEQAGQAAQAAKTASEIDVSEGSPLQALLN